MKQKLLIKTVILFNLFSLALLAQAAPTSAVIPYYGDDFYNNLNSGIANEDLVLGLKQILRSYHVPVNGRNDKIAATCNGINSCYAHRSVGYTQARVFLMGKFYLTSSNGQYGVRDVYCQRTYMESEFTGQKPAPGKIPDNKILNAEHTWPQSRFSTNYAADIQKSDMHHLFPSDSRLNGVRSSNEFGEVSKDRLKFNCKTTARFGDADNGSVVFEPPQTHKGNVARALFYFSVRYDLPIRENEEAVLRKWNREDPVDGEEFNRNEEILALQGDRNPFVDFPELAERINNF